MQSLSLTLADSADDILRELTVVGVEPAPDASRLLVTVAPSASVGSAGGTVQVADVLARLAAASPRLRRELASFITRKRAPELVFVVAGGGEVMP